MTTTQTNGRARKSLAEQIDRLDAILDGLSEALQGAVTSAVTEAVSLAVKEAVQGVLAELLTNPALQEKLREAAAPPPAAEPPPPTAPGSRLRERLSRLGGRARALGGWASRGLAALWQRVRQARWLVAGPLALAPGLLAGALAYLVTWPVAPAAARLAGMAGALLGQARALVRQALAVPATGA